jgi:hypothetical protein
MLSYVCHVRRAGTEYETSVDTYQGDMPRAGEIVTLVVHGEAMKGRVSVVTVPQHKPRGDPVVHVYVDEVCD